MHEQAINEWLKARKKRLEQRQTEKPVQIKKQGQSDFETET